MMQNTALYQTVDSFRGIEYSIYNIAICNAIYS